MRSIQGAAQASPITSKEKIMNWVVPVLQFAYGFFRGVEQGFADRQAGRRLPYEADDSNDWGGHMRALAHATDGVELLTVKPKSASFGISFRSDTYRMGPTA